ncbi:unnamed protein product [Spirodela intermedia]|uniref:DUF4219 domain-containing protein n=1 Tax=Spirodela intermedia TaxID=51605 RepID=A0A7I8IKR8_SPIIN|nr:unnamed protein product [Spirodela intermedia]CAA6658114.1 unnamed protein product [Spirodela intermedia]
MPRRGDATESESLLATSRATKGPGDAGYPGTFPIFNKTNYPLWAMRMQLCLEAHSLWDAIESNLVARKKDRHIQTQLDITKTAKETWELLKSTHVGVARLMKTRLQSLRREFEMLQMGDEENMTDFSGKLSCLVTQIRNLGEKVEEGTVGAKLLRATPAKFDPLTTSLEQFRDIDTMPFEEAVGSLKIYEEKLQNRQERKEQVLLTHRTEKTKGGNPCGGGHGQGRGRGRGRG